MDPRTAKRYADSPEKPEYTLSKPKLTKVDAYKQLVDERLTVAPYSAIRILEKLRENLESLNIVDVLDYIFAEEAKSRQKRAYEQQIQMSGFPIKKTLDDFDFSSQPSIDKRQIDELPTMRFLETGESVVFLGPPGVDKTHLASSLSLMDEQHRFSTYYGKCHQLIARRYEKTSTIFTSGKTFSQWNEVFADVTIAPRYTGSHSASLHRHQHQGRVLQIERA